MHFTKLNLAKCGQVIKGQWEWREVQAEGSSFTWLQVWHGHCANINCDRSMFYLSAGTTPHFFCYTRFWLMHNSKMRWVFSLLTCWWHRVQGFWFNMSKQAVQLPVVQFCFRHRKQSLFNPDVSTIQLSRKSPIFSTSVTMVPFSSLRSSAGLPLQQPGANRYWSVHNSSNNFL